MVKELGDYPQQAQPHSEKSAVKNAPESKETDEEESSTVRVVALK